MAKTKAQSKKYVVHKKLEEPMHNMVGYTVLLLFALLTLYVAYSYL